MPFFGGGGGGGGGSNTSSYTTTVPEIYDSIKEAITAGHVSILIDADHTEPVGTVSIPEGQFELAIAANAVLDMGTVQFSRGGFSETVFIDGPGEISYSGGLGQPLFLSPHSTDTFVIAEGVTIRNVGTDQINGAFDSAFNQILRDCKVYAGNNSTAGLRFKNFYSLINVDIYGSGSSCDDALVMNVTGSVSGHTKNVRFLGTFKSGARLALESGARSSHKDWLISSEVGSGRSIDFAGSTVENLENKNTSLEINLGDDSRLKNTQQLSSNNITVNIDGTQCNVSDCYIQTLTETASASENDNVYTGVRVAGTFTATSQLNQYDNCEFGTHTIVSGAKPSIANCKFTTALTIDSGAGATLANCAISGTFANNDGANSRLHGCTDGSGERWMNNDGRIEFKPTSTTDATKTQLYIDASSLQFELNSNDVLHGTLKVTCVRDNQNEAVFYVPVFTAKNDGGTTTVSAPGTLSALTPDDSSGTGSTLTLDVEADDTNDAPAFYITCNASENWNTVAELTFTVVNN